MMRRSLPRVRRGVQLAVIALLAWTAWRFVAYVGFLRAFHTGTPVDRPEAAEAFLPIGALVALRAWLAGQGFDAVHPAALVIFLAAMGISLLVARSFCAWICPVGLAHELLAWLGLRIWRRPLRLPRWADLPLRGIKYLLLGFFALSVFVLMSGEEAAGFLASPYWAIADVRMLAFFAPPSAVTVAVLAALAVLAVVLPPFWCRYLCPYGAWLGLFGVLTPAPVTRDPGPCTECGACTRACPNHIAVDRGAAVRSPECSGCLDCVAVCPARGALDVRIAGAGRRVSPWLVAAAVVVGFATVLAVGRLTGHWETALADWELARFIAHQGVFGGGG